MAYLIAAPFIAVLYLIFGTKTGRKIFFWSWIASMILTVLFVICLAFYAVFLPEHAEYLQFNDFGEGLDALTNRLTHWFPWQRPDEWTRIGS